MIETTVKVDGMMCGMCEAHVSDAIRGALPVKKVTASHTKGQAVILSEAPLDEEAVSRYLECIESLFWPLVNQYQGGESIGDLPSLEAVSTQVLDMVLFGIVRQER